jgi:hypothetical protein
MYCSNDICCIHGLENEQAENIYKKRAAAKLNATPLCDFRMSAFFGLTSAHIFSITINLTVSASKVKGKVKPKAVVVCLADGGGHNVSPEK